MKHANLSCSKCQFKAKTKNSIKYHIESGKCKTIPCDFCDYKAWSDGNLRNHKKFRHQIKYRKARNIPCDLCEYKAWTTINLKYHIKIRHGVGKRKKISNSKVNEDSRAAHDYISDKESNKAEINVSLVESLKTIKFETGESKLLQKWVPGFKDLEKKFEDKDEDVQTKILYICNQCDYNSIKRQEERIKAQFKTENIIIQNKLCPPQDLRSHIYLLHKAL